MKNFKLNISAGVVILFLGPFFLIYASKNSSDIQERSLIIVNVCPCRYNNQNSFTDNRDKKVYQQIQIGDQCWMAENLSYGKLTPDMEQSNNNIPEKSYYENENSIGERMGALYTWEEAMNYGKGKEGYLQGLCPDGWHIPSDKEWGQLTQFLDHTVNMSQSGWSGKNIALLIVENTPPANSFNAKLSGNAVSGWYFYLDEMCYFWTSSPYSNSSSWYRAFTKDSKQIYRGPGDIKLGMSVRCIKNK